MLQHCLEWYKLVLRTCLSAPAVRYLVCSCRCCRGRVLYAPVRWCPNKGRYVCYACRRVFI